MRRIRNLLMPRRHQETYWKGGQIYYPGIALALIGGFITYAVARKLAFPHLASWALHLLTVALATICSAVATYLVMRGQLNELRREEQFMRGVVDNVPMGIVACDTEGKIVFHNAAFRRFHRLSEHLNPPPEMELDLDLYMADGQTPMPKEQIPSFRVLQGEPVSELESVIVPKGGEAIAVLVCARAMVDLQGERSGAVVVIQDVTERKRVQEIAARNAASLAEAQRIVHLGSWGGTYKATRCIGPMKPIAFLVLSHRHSR